MKEKVLTTLHTLLILTFLISLVGGVQIVDAKPQADQFPFASEIFIKSPSNRTYTPGLLTLNVSVRALVGRNIEHSMAYSLDGVYKDKILIEIRTRENSFVAAIIGTLTLPALAYGSHSITVYAEHHAYFADHNETGLNNSTVYFSISDTIPLEETIPPKISNLSLENKTYNSAEISFTFNLDKTVSWIAYSLDNQANRTIADLHDPEILGRQFNTTLKGLSDGSHSLSVYATDTFDNTGVSDTVSFAVDTVSPAISNLTIQNETYTSNELELNFSVNEAASWISYSLDNQDNVTILGNTTIAGLLNGRHNITVYANDTAGNTGASETVYFSVEVPEPFPTTIVATASLMSVASASAGLFVHFRKIKKRSA